MTTTHRALIFLLSSLLLCLPMKATQVTYDGRSLMIDGKRKIIISGSIHYPRSTPQMWPDLIQKAKEGGLNAIETYVFWNLHEPDRREYHFDGKLDFIKFFKVVQQAGLYAILRIGPYVCAEWNYGGLPIWLHNIPGIQLRTDNQIYKDEMQIFTTKIVEMVKTANLLAPQGGPIILTQIENEYGNVDYAYGNAAKTYLQWCAKMALSQNVGVPWVMCQQSDAPSPMINTCNGFYCDGWKPNNATSPTMWTENWTGWFKGWANGDPHRPAEDLAFAVARFFQKGGIVQNYYMYHGGTSFGRTTGGPYLATSYDYDAPLDEYGNPKEPKYGHLKQLHELLFKMEDVLTAGTSSTTKFENYADAWVTVFSLNGNSACFLSNSMDNQDATVTYQGKQYFLPAWSVSVLPDCKEEAYNTAKLTTQGTIMTKKATGTAPLKWIWRPESNKAPLRGEGTFSAKQLLEQKAATNDTSDYLWYTTSVDDVGGQQMLLSVNTSGHGLHVFVNGRLVGSHYAPYGSYSFKYQTNVTFNRRKSIITLLSSTVGLANYGSFFDLVPVGINGGPVQLRGSKGGPSVDLSNSTWFYTVGLIGEKKGAYNSAQTKWITGPVPTNRFMTWYKTTFAVPPGSDPVVVDLQGMGKGQVYVNGQSLGRYWVTMIAPKDGCSPCDYRGGYRSSNCVTDCGLPTQRWYHVPREFLQAGQNTLVLFEELGGNPANVSLQTVVVGSICGSLLEVVVPGMASPVMQLQCPSNRTISSINFASFGDPKGVCGSFQKGSCDASNTLSVVQEACVGKSNCSITVSDGMFGSSGTCGSTAKRLSVQATCR